MAAGAGAAGAVTDKDPAGSQLAAAGASLRWPHHPGSGGAANELADFGHTVKNIGAQVSWDSAGMASSLEGPVHPPGRGAMSSEDIEGDEWGA